MDTKNKNKETHIECVCVCRGKSEKDQKRNGEQRKSHPEELQNEEREWKTVEILEIGIRMESEVSINHNEC